MGLTALLLLTICQGILIGANAKTFPVNQCFSTQTPKIPRCHLYHRKCKPLIIGHRGNPGKYQENTLEGFANAVRNGADGVECDAILTKDKKLVCFHDTNAKRLTGVDRNIADMTFHEVRQLKIKKNIMYGANNYTYAKTRRVAPLESLLRFAKRRRLVVYLDLKPDTVVLTSAADFLNAVETGKAVGALVKKYRMANQVLVTSFDLLKPLNAKMVEPKLVVGVAWSPGYWLQPDYVHAALKAQIMAHMPGLSTCLASVSSANNAIVNFLYTSGTIEKSMKAAFTDVDYRIFNHPHFGGAANLHTIQMLKNNYGPNIVVGTYTTYDLSLTRSQASQLEALYKVLINQGIHMITTDDVERMSSLAASTSAGRRNCLRRRRHPYYGDAEEEERDENADQGGNADNEENDNDDDDDDVNDVEFLSDN